MPRPSTRSTPAKGPSQRQLRAGELIRHALVDILQREDLRDPDLEGVIVTVSEVRTSPDMKHATAFVAPLGGGDGAKTAKALQRCAGFLRGCLGRQIELRFTPELHFEPDLSFDEATRMNALLADPKVRRDVEG
jgi:ribosome-binding factor A